MTAGKPHVPWTEAEVAQVVRLYEAGRGPAAIARVIGRTRNAVIGRMNRMGLRCSRDVVRAARVAAGRATGALNSARKKAASTKPPAPKRTGKNNNPCGWGTSNRAAKPKAAYVKDGKRAVPELPATLPCVARASIDTLGPRQCRYIGERPEVLALDTPVYCGQATDGGSWCPEHRARCVVPVPRSAERLVRIA